MVFVDKKIGIYPIFSFINEIDNKENIEQLDK